MLFFFINTLHFWFTCTAGLSDQTNFALAIEYMCLRAVGKYLAFTISPLAGAIIAYDENFLPASHFTLENG